jgi:hypothetical protein
MGDLYVDRRTLLKYAIKKHHAQCDMDSNCSKYSVLEHKLMKVSAPRKEENVFEQQNVSFLRCLPQTFSL